MESDSCHELTQLGFQTAPRSGERNGDCPLHRTSGDDHRNSVLDRVFPLTCTASNQRAWTEAAREQSGCLREERTAAEREQCELLGRTEFDGNLSRFLW